MYKFVKLVRDQIKEYQKQKPEIADSTMHFHPMAVDTIKLFAEQNGLTLNVAQNIAAFTADEGWLIVDKNAYCLNKKSYEITEGIRYFRIGLINEWAKSFGTTFTLTLSLIAIVISLFALMSGGE